MVSQMVSNDPRLAQLGTLRGRLSVGHAERMAHCGDDAWMGKALERWVRLREEYERELADYIVATLPATVAAARDELVARLTRGLSLPPTKETDAAFDILLGRYMAAQDGVDGVVATRLRLDLDERTVTRALVVACLNGVGAEQLPAEAS